jgi:hypothetical protein
VGRREEPDPGAGPVPAAAAHATGTNRAAQPQLHAPRNPQLVRRSRRRHRQGHRAFYPRHRGREFLAFPREIEGNVPPDLDIYLIMDNDATHKTGPIRKWLGAQARWHVHFTPTASSWVNQRGRCGLSAFQASSDSQNKLFPMTIPPATQIRRKYIIKINKVYGFSTLSVTRLGRTKRFWPKCSRTCPAADQAASPTVLLADAGYEGRWRVPLRHTANGLTMWSTCNRQSASGPGR